MIRGYLFRTIFVLLLGAYVLPAPSALAQTEQSAVLPAVVYSPALFTGTYGFAFSAVVSDSVSYYGVMTADGKGHITSGRVFMVPAGATEVCEAVFNGTYSLASTTYGAMTLNFSAVTTSSCGALEESTYMPKKAGFFILASQQGAMISVVGNQAQRVSGGPMTNTFSFVLGRQ